MRFFDHIRKSPHRNLLEKVLRKLLPTVEGPLLDIGSKSRRYDHLLKHVPIAIDIIENTEKEVHYGDVTDLQFPDGSFNGILCLEVLEYIALPQKAIHEMHRVLSQHGTLILSVPFMYKIHGDKLRYTKEYLRELLSEFAKVEFHVIGTAYSIILDIVWGNIQDIGFAPLRYLCLALYTPFTVLALMLRMSKGEKYVSGYCIVAKK